MILNSRTYLNSCRRRLPRNSVKKRLRKENWKRKTIFYRAFSKEHIAILNGGMRTVWDKAASLAGFYSANPFCDFTWVSSLFLSGTRCNVKWNMFVSTLALNNYNMHDSLLERTPRTASQSVITFCKNIKLFDVFSKKGFNISLSWNLKTERIRGLLLKKKNIYAQTP